MPGTTDFSVAQLDNILLGALVTKLINDRNVRVATCLAATLRELSEGAQPPLQGREKERSWPTQVSGVQEQKSRCQWQEGYISVSAITNLLNRAISSGPDAAEWQMLEGKFSEFLHSIITTSRRQVELKVLVGQATQALEPLFGVLDPVRSDTADEIEADASHRLSRCRGFYAYAVSLLLQLYLSDVRGAERIAWLKQCRWRTELQDILLPFICREVEPLERELAFHFQKGRSTARREEPQHFFRFLLDAYTRLVSNARAHGWAPEGAGEENDAVTLTALGSVVLAVTAVSVFRDAYGWHGGSGYLLVQDFTVHGVNCLIDFLTKSGGIVHPGAQAHVVEQLLSLPTIRAYTDAARLVASEAYTTGHRTQWRLEFLASLPPAVNVTAVVSVTWGTHHMLRCLEAIMRRLSMLFTAAPACAAIAWSWVVVPSLATFLQRLDEAKEETTALCETRAQLIIGSLHFLDSVQAVCSAAEEWHGLCRGFATEKDLPIDQLLKVQHWKDELLEETAESVVQVLGNLLASGGVSPQDLHAWDGILQCLSQNPSATSSAVQEVIRTSIPHIITTEAREHLREYCHATGANVLANLLATRPQ